MSFDLRQHYLDYLTTLNERRFDDLDVYVAEHLRYNQDPVTRRQYEADRRHEARIIPDLRYRADLLIVEGNFVAARLDFRCTPIDTFLGLPPTGRSIRFTEHVFYQFSDRVIVAVTSLLDVPAIERQLRPPR